MAGGFSEQWFDFGPDAWLIAYDIADPQRLARVHRCLKAVALPVQYSVFLGWFSDGRIATLVRELEARIDPRCDDVRLYHLPARTQLYRLGRQWMPERVYLLGDTWRIGGAPAIGPPPAGNPGNSPCNALACKGNPGPAD